MPLGSKRKIICLLFFVSFWFCPRFVSADDSRGDRTESNEKPLEVRWEIDVGGQVRLRGDFARNQNFTNFAFTPDHKEVQFLERTRLQASVEDHALNLEAFVQGQWYGRWGGLDNRSAFDLYQGYIGWDKILGSPISLRGGPSGIFIWLCILSRHK